MLKKLKNKSQGFTIIEVMIVLAVAALIILIVLLAVPALQRSSRNTTIKSDASTVASAISNYETNNNGLLPTVAQTPSPLTGTVYVGSNPATSPGDDATAKVQGTTIVLPLQVGKGAAPGTGSTAAVGTIAPGSIEAYAGQECGASPYSSPTVNSRSVAVYYVTESGGSNYQLQCIDT